MYACATEIEEMARIVGELHSQFRILATGKTRVGKRVIDKNRPQTAEERKAGVQHYKELKITDEARNELKVELEKDIAEMKRLISVCEASLSNL